MAELNFHETTSEQAAKSPPKAPKILAGTRRTLHRRWPSIFPDPDYEADLAVWRRRDQERNTSTTPPAQEFIELCCVWGMEFYTPLHIESLVNGITKLGWDRTTRPSSNPIPWIRDLRRTTRISGEMNLGNIVRPGNNDLFGTSLTGPLPEGIDRASVQILNLTSSIACMLVCFILDDESSHGLNNILRTEFSTRLEPTRLGQTIHSPDSQKREAINGLRLSTRLAVASWFKRNFPGVFSSMLPASDFPICELLTFQHAMPFPQRDETVPNSHGYLHTLGLRFNRYAWQLESIPAIRFATQDPLSDDLPFYSFLALKQNMVADTELQPFGGRSRDGYVAYVDNIVDKLLSRWGLTVVLAAYERQLNALRDSLRLQSKSSRSSIRILQALSDFAAQGIDISAAATELRSYAEQRPWFLSEVGAFRPVDRTQYSAPDLTLAETLRCQIKAGAEWTLNTGTSMRAVFSQYAEILGARENVKAQRKIGTLTWVLVILTVFIALLSGVIAYAALQTEQIAALLKILKGFFQ